MRQYEQLARDATKSSSCHIQTEQVQRMFLVKVEKLTKAIQDLGNYFQEETRRLLSLDVNDTHYKVAKITSRHL